jgi:hypothetical protein
MKKVISVTIFLFALCIYSFGQFNFSTNPYKAPKGAVNLNKVKLGTPAKVKVGQLIYYQSKKTSNMAGFSIGVSGEGTEMIKKTETHIYKDKNKNEITTFQWKTVKRGKTKIEITDESGKESFIEIEIE